MWLKADIAGVLMPADEALVSGSLMNRVVPTTRISGPVLNCVENARIMGDPVKHGQHIMRIVSPRRVKLMSERRLGLGQFGNDLLDLAGVKNINPVDIAIFIIGGALGNGQFFQHGWWPFICQQFQPEHASAFTVW